MPRVAKRKKQESSEEESKSATSSSDTDSGPEDRNPAPKGKSKSVVSKNSVVSGAKRTEDAEPTWELDRNRFLKVREFKGKTLIDIREFYEKDGKQLPGKKGISLSDLQWKKLVAIIPEVDDVLNK